MKFKLSTQQKILAAVIAITLIILLLSREQAQPQVEHEVKSLDMFIPTGHVLVPIDVENSEALDQILGPFGVVNLYSSKDKTKSTLVARGLKIFRSPQNQHSFAVMVPEVQAPKIVQAMPPFYVVVQNPTTTGTQFEDKAIRKSRIIWE